MTPPKGEAQRGFTDESAVLIYERFQNVRLASHAFFSTGRPPCLVTVGYALHLNYGPQH